MGTFENGIDLDGVGILVVDSLLLFACTRTFKDLRKANIIH